MKTTMFLFSFFCTAACFAQEKLLQDIDGDSIIDTIYLDLENPAIIAKLSTANFTKASSKTLELLGDQNSVRKTKSGFELSAGFMRGGHACQFRYNAVAKKIQLIGISTYEFGNAANDGSGEGSVNLLTNNYIGNWNYFDEKQEKLVKLATIKQKMSFGKIYLNTFDGKIIDDFLDKSAALYAAQKKQAAN